MQVPAQEQERVRVRVQERVLARLPVGAAALRRLVADPGTAADRVAVVVADSLGSRKAAAGEVAVDSNGAVPAAVRAGQP